MSTFGGCMPEFPDIRVDYFRTVKGVRPPLACFLSHVHSDHLHGLESLKAPFVYCSAATKEILIRLERYPHRINFQLGILESRRQQYKQLKSLLRPVPLETPTTIELAPGNEIQVTLFNANHCTGAVMFLIEGGGTAVLYTGDIRSEPWFVNNLRRNPSLIEYTSGLKTLDCIYLDTSFTDRVPFPTKAEGITELLRKVAKYPPGTIFHFTAWTYGYEEVWLALSRALESKVHVDKYKMRIYQSLRGNSASDTTMEQHLAPEGPALAGFKFGNHVQDGILTLDQNVRLHSCEKTTECKCNVADNTTVWIRPIITRISGKEVSEIGIGGGGGDLTGRPELELDSDAAIRQLMALFSNVTSPIKSEVRDILETALHSKGKALSLDELDLELDNNELSLNDLLNILTRSVTHKHEEKQSSLQPCSLSKVITFPYSRHSSFFELRDLIGAFKPLDVYPCTVDETSWNEDSSMATLFGDLCTGDVHRHDLEMRKIQDVSSDSSQEPSMTNPDFHSKNKSSQFEIAESVIPRHIRIGDMNSLKADNLTNAERRMSTTALDSSHTTRSLQRDERGRLRLVPNSSLRGETSRNTSKRQTQDLEDSSTSHKPDSGLGNDETTKHVSLFASSGVISGGAHSGTELSSSLNLPFPEFSDPIEAASPGAQDIRRNAYFDDNGRNKRAKTYTAEALSQHQLKRRVAFTDDNKLPWELSPALETAILKTPFDLRNRNESATYGIYGIDANDPSSKDVSFGFAVNYSGPGDGALDNDRRRRDNGGTSQDSEDKDEAPKHDPQGNNLGMNGDHEAIESVFYFDYEDKVYRCVSCHWECWRPEGFCESCDVEAGNYYTVLDSNGRQRNVLSDPLHSQLQLQADSEALYGHNLDQLDDSLTVSSESSDVKPDEYEMNSFIDDSSIHSAGDDPIDGPTSESDSDGDDIDYKSLYQQKCAEYETLQESHFEFVAYHEDFRRDLLGSEYDSLDDSEVEGFDGAVPINVQVRDPPISEMELSFQAQGDSQGSTISDGRAMAREDAFNAASHVDGTGWHNVSLMSTGDNHTSAEPEL